MVGLWVFTVQFFKLFCILENFHNKVWRENIVCLCVFVYITHTYTQVNTGKA